MDEMCSVTEDEFAILADGSELFALEVLDPADEHATIDLVMTGRRQAISRASILRYPQIRGMNSNIFRSGEWARITGVSVACYPPRICFDVD